MPALTPRIAGLYAIADSSYLDDAGFVPAVRAALDGGARVIQYRDKWGLGMDDSGPVSVEGSAVYNPDGWYETPDTTEIKYTYANGVVMMCRQKLDTKGPDQGTEFIGDKGSLFVYRGGILANPAELLKGVPRPKITGSQANFSHVNNFFDCVKTRKTPAADISIGHRSATVCHLGNIAVRTKKKITWDPQLETIVGDADAAKWLTKISPALEPGLKRGGHRPSLDSCARGSYRRFRSERQPAVGGIRK